MKNAVGILLGVVFVLGIFAVLIPWGNSTVTGAQSSVGTKVANATQ